MTALLTLSLWSLLLGLFAWRPGRPGPRRLWVTAALLPALLSSSLWPAGAWIDQVDEPLPLAGPETAYLSVWVLVLLPILRRRLGLDVLGRSLYAGLVAAAAAGLALEIAVLALSAPLPPIASAPGALALQVSVLAVLLVAGLGLCLLAMPDAFPWELPAWYAGWLLMAQAAMPAPLGTSVATWHGAPALAACLALAVLVRALIGRAGLPA